MSVRAFAGAPLPNPPPALARGRRAISASCGWTRNFADFCPGDWTSGRHPWRNGGVARARAKGGAGLVARLERARGPRDRLAKRLVGRIQEEDRARRRAAFRIGECLARIHRERLWANLGYRRIEELFAAIGIGRAQAFKLIAVAERSTADEVAALGVEGAYARAIRRR